MLFPRSAAVCYSEPMKTAVDTSASAISPLIREKAPLILAEITKATSILLHCHPSPDPDSVGSALAMKFALESMGKKATVIAGDSEIPQAFMRFPGATEIVPRNFSEVDLSQFDLFIIQDATLDRVTNAAPCVFPGHLTLINIDHHASNTGGAKIDLIVSSYPATAQILFDLFEIWKLPLTHDIAADLFIGMYTDTGGFKYTGTTGHTFAIAGELIGSVPDFSKLISDMENSNTPESLAFEGLALSSIEAFFDGSLGLSIVSNAAIKGKGIPAVEVSGGIIAGKLRSVAEWKVSGSLIEDEPGHVKASFRSKDGDAFDVSRLAVALGGGGHRAAAGATMTMSLDEAKRLVVAKAKELYNL